MIRPPSGCVVIGQLEHRASVLQTAAAEGLRAAWMALEGEDPELIGTLRAYPRATPARRRLGTGARPARGGHGGAPTASRLARAASSRSRGART